MKAYELLIVALASLALLLVFLWTSTKINQSFLVPLHSISNGALIAHQRTKSSYNLNPNHHVNNTSQQQQTKLLCWVMTVDLEEHKKKCQAIKETWGKRCDLLLFVRNGSKLAQYKLPNENEDENENQINVLTVPLKHEGRDQLWHKASAAFSYLHDHYLNQFDWFMKADDDTYVLVDQLKGFLKTKSLPTEPVYFGYRFKPYVNQGYMSGGSGYVLSRQAVKLLVEEGFRKNEGERCHLKEGQVEDVEMGICLESVGVSAGDTRDNQGKPTFLALSPEHLIEERKVDTQSWYYAYAFYGPPKPGKDCCSNRPISFHYIDPHLMYLIDWLLYDVKRDNNNLNSYY